MISGNIEVHEGPVRIRSVDLVRMAPGFVVLEIQLEDKCLMDYIAGWRSEALGGERRPYITIYRDIEDHNPTEIVLPIPVQESDIRHWNVMADLVKDVFRVVVYNSDTSWRTSLWSIMGKQ